MADDDRQRERDQFVRLERDSDPALRDQLVEDNLWLARHCARRFANKGEPLDDLEQVASLALVKAVDRFDPAVGVRFSTFAVPTIMGELRRHFRDRTWGVRVTRRLKELHLELKAASEVLGHELGRPPSVEELADALDKTVEEVLEALEAGASYRASSLSAPSPDGEEQELNLPDAADEIEESATRLAIGDALATLDERDRRIVYLRFYLGLTQAEIAEEVGVSQVHVSRLLRTSLAHLGDQLRGADLVEG